MQNVEKLLNSLIAKDPEVVRKLGMVYNDDTVERVVKLLSSFMERFPDSKDVTIVRAPGRVNLIGEHTDYNGLPVMPMALDYDMMVALSPRSDKKVRVVNPDYPDRSFMIEKEIPRFETGDWGNYIKAGVQGIVDQQGGDIEKLSGFNASYLGTVPVGSGLSSSSTVVVASALALMTASDLEWEPIAFAEQMAKAEWYVGTQGGGMDHASSILNQKGKALKIDFFPLRVVPATIPEGFSIVVANSMVVAEKTREMRMNYNMRPSVCRMATALMVRKLGLEGEGIERLGDIYFKLGRVETEKALKANLWWRGYTKNDLTEQLGITLEELNDQYCTTKSGEHISGPPEGFKLLARARHVVSEAARVEDALVAANSGDGKKLGELMFKSHTSCRKNYELSVPALNDLVNIGREAGSSGSRLTGAGFGGCTVHLVRDEILEQFIDEVQRRYYDDAIMAYPEAFRRYEEKGKHALLALRPAGGANVLF